MKIKTKPISLSNGLEDKGIVSQGLIRICVGWSRTGFGKRLTTLPKIIGPTIQIEFPFR